MEIKTLEQYAIAKIQEYENQIEDLKQCKNDYLELLTSVCKLVELGLTSDNDSVVLRFSNVYERYDKEQFDTWVKLLQIEDKHKELLSTLAKLQSEKEHGEDE